MTMREAWPVFVSLLGSFGLLKHGRVVDLRSGGKSQTLVAELAIQSNHGLERAELLGSLWPRSEPELAAHSLNTLLYDLHRRLGDVLNGQPPIVHQGSTYFLNVPAGIGVDIAAFESAASTGDAARRAGNAEGAKCAYTEAAALYRGDLCVGEDVRHVLDRERLRVRYLTLQDALADILFAEAHYRRALERSLDLLAHDPCREDAHRLAMRCYVRLGERAQAFRQYQLCRSILRAEFDAEPEAATTALFDQVRQDATI